MRKLYFTFFAVFVLLQTSCDNRSEIFKGLQRADSLLSAGNDSTAAIIFYQIPPQTDSTAETALYNYVSAKINVRCQEYQNPELLDFPIEYFKAQNDLKHLAYAYNYKSFFLLYYSNDISNALIYNKEAEELAENINDDILKYNIYSTGYTISSYHLDTEECLKYADKAYRIGEKLHDKRRMAYPARFLTVCYNDKNVADSAEKYMAVCLSFLDCYDMGAKAAVFTAFGNAMFTKNPVFAEQCYLESVGVIDNADAYNGLTRLYLEQGNMTKAAECFPKAISENPRESNVELMKLYAEKLEKAGQNLEAFKIYKEISLQKDSLYKIKENNLLRRWDNLNKFYHTQKNDFNDLKHSLLWFKVLTLVLSVLLLTVIIFVLKKLRKREGKTVSIAENLYNQIVKGESISQWTKDEREIFTDYYYTQNSEFQAEVSSNYDKLPVNAHILLILQKLGKSKTEIMDIMGFSDQAYRSLKSRTDKAKK
ncbi:MAG: hypothetical protein II956_12325 [Bacteroidales bacterium]|nr:hypothetical protein [Bacteroidales bacterium]